MPILRLREQIGDCPFLNIHGLPCAPSCVELV
jgi:hypothetical protein